MELAGLYLYAYLVGSIPTAYVIARLVRGIDIRRYGSGTVGGSNLFRQTGWRWPIVLGVFEVFVKGASSVWIGLYLLDLERDSYALIVAPLLSVVGHNWSVFLKLYGGRGVVVSGGALLALPAGPPWALFMFLGFAIGGWAVSRSSAVSVLVSLLLLPLWAWLLHDSASLTVFCGCLIFLLLAKRLLANWEALPADLPKRKVLMNRLLRDRDTIEQGGWVTRAPADDQRNDVA